MLGKYKPSSLSGGFERYNYFEGWFQKVYSTKHKASFIIIYGYATRNTNDTFGFIQVLIPGNIPELIYFSKNEISCDPDRHFVRMGTNILAMEVIRINTVRLSIHLNLNNNYPIRTFKNSMGYTYFIPNLPCYHAVLNTYHPVSGEIRYNDVQYSLDSELGYLEKNWGTSFPENYFWLHAVDPNDSQVSLLFSRAEIKWLGKKFIKHVGHFRFEGKQIDLRELKNFAVSTLVLNPHSQLIQISSKTIQLDILIMYGNKVMFKGPEEGNLSRDILHHSDALIDVTFTDQDKVRKYQMMGNFENIGVS